MSNSFHERLIFLFVDVVKIFVKAGNGGNGAVAFHREKYVPNGGPDGGDGGKGGNIIVKANPNLRTLLDFRYHRHFRAKNGENGSGSNMTGKQGENLIIEVPLGTLIKDAETGRVLADMHSVSEDKVLLKGGQGGRGNAKFAHSTRQAPRFAQPGEKTKEREIVLELKSIADVGLIGFPNVGKSTLLSVVTSAKPKIANYHFTTLTPNLGVIKTDSSSFVIADIPGIIEGANKGAGLGHAFLRHIERTRILVHVVDVSGLEGRDPIEDYNKVNEELFKYSEILAQRPQVVVANKIDVMPEDSDNYKKLKEYVNAKGQKIFKISAVTRDGIKELIEYLTKMVGQLEPIEPFPEEEIYTYEEETYEIEKIAQDVFDVHGTYIDRLVDSVFTDDMDSMRFFHRSLKDKGIIKELKKLGIKNGDTVILGDIEFDYVE